MIGVLTSKEQIYSHTMAYQVTFWWDNDVMLPTFASSVKQLQADLFIHLDTLYWLWAISLCFYSLIWGSNSLEAKWGGEIHLKEIWWYTNMYMIVGTVKNSTEYKIKKIYINTVNPSGHLRFLINTKQTLYRSIQDIDLANNNSQYILYEYTYIINSY
jgi:hypothetical protein